MPKEKYPISGGQAGNVQNVAKQRAAVGLCSSEQRQLQSLAVPRSGAVAIAMDLLRKLEPLVDLGFDEQ